MSGGYVYRAFDASGRLLYVGCSVDVDGRLNYHRDNASWWLFHDRIEVESFDTRDDAAEAEARAIATEHPRWNMQGRSQDHPDGFAHSLRGAHWLEYEADVARRTRQLMQDEASLLRKIRKVRMGLAGVRAEAEAIKSGLISIDEDVA